MRSPVPPTHICPYQAPATPPPLPNLLIVSFPRYPHPFPSPLRVRLFLQTMKPLLDVQFFLYQRREEVREATNVRDDVLSISTRVQFEADWERALDLEAKARAKQVWGAPRAPPPSSLHAATSPVSARRSAPRRSQSTTAHRTTTQHRSELHPTQSHHSMVCASMRVWRATHVL